MLGVAPGALPDRLELAWAYETGGPVVSSPVSDGVFVYVGSSDQALHAVDLATGDKRWVFKTDDIIDAPPLVHGGRVYVGSYDFFFYAVDAANGGLLWKHETGDKILGAATHFRGADGVERIIVGSYDSVLYGFDAASGEVLWRHKTADSINSTASLAGHEALFGGCDALLHRVDVRTGVEIGAIELGEGCQVGGPAAVVGRTAYLGHYGEQVIAVDLDSGDMLWSFRSPRRQPFYASPAVVGDRVIAAGRDKGVYCLDRASGEVQWTYSARRKIDASPVVCGDKVLIGSGDGRFVMLRLDDGEEVWSYDLGKAVFSSAAVVGQRVLVGCNDGKLYCFEAPE